jgi:hypothetical protein
MALIIATLTFVPSAFAQTVRLRADIPFDFYMNDQLMPAGLYTVSTLSDGKIVQVLSVKGTGSRFVMTDSTQNRLSETTRLVFHRYGDLNFLAQLHWKGQSIGREVRTTPLELEARNRATPVRVAIVPK